MSRKLDPTTLCQHHSKDGKQCHMLLAADNPTLCPFHARSDAKRVDLQRDDSEDLSALFNQDLPKQKTAADIHTHLWNLSLALQQGRISPRRAAVLAYIHSLLLRTLPAIDKQNSSGDSAGIDMTGAPRPIRNLPPPHHSPSQYSPGTYTTPNSRAHSAVVATPSFRSGESSDSHPSYQYTPGGQTPALPTPDDKSKICHSEQSEESAFKPTPTDKAPDFTPDDPPPSTYPKPVPLPRWGEICGTIRQPERPNTYGPPRMRARRSPRRVAQRPRSEMAHRIAHRTPKTLHRASGAPKSVVFRAHTQPMPARRSSLFKDAPSAWRVTVACVDRGT
jgi:hypothetical protein